MPTSADEVKLPSDEALNHEPPLTEVDQSRACEQSPDALSETLWWSVADWPATPWKLGLADLLTEQGTGVTVRVTLTVLEPRLLEKVSVP